MRILIVALLAGLSASVPFANADVGPSCGKRKPREPAMVRVGDACGGPFVCTQPSKCATLDTSIRTPSYESAYVCTKACSSDAECIGLGISMLCTGTGRFGSSDKPTERVCIPTIATDASAPRATPAPSSPAVP